MMPLEMLISTASSPVLVAALEEAQAVRGATHLRLMHAFNENTILPLSQNQVRPVRP